MNNETFAKNSDVSIGEIPGRFIDQVKDAFELNNTLNALNAEYLEAGKPLMDKPGVTSMLGGAALNAVTELPKQVVNSVGSFAVKLLLEDLKFPIA